MFDFSEAMHGLIRHITAVRPEFAHVRPEELLVSYIVTRSPGVHGIYASCQPLRFKGGERTHQHRGRTYSMPEVKMNGKEMLYILYFAMPRFMNLDFETKMTTVFHELYHVSPKFNGDIRRFRGKNYAHGHSRKVFNQKVWGMASEYLAMPESSETTAFLRMSFDDLAREYGKVVGTKIRPPKPKPI
ncbi:MAG TPA: putative metallopeptidase [Armatimonadota bacterium]|jgi:predicted metallopeptidase